MTPKILLYSLLGLSAGVVLSIPSALGQRPGSTGPTNPTNPTGGPTGPTGGPTGPGGIGRPTAPGTTIPSTRSPFPEMNRPIFLSGKVVLSDGSKLSDPVLIERVCNGNPHPEGYTDSKGRFSIQLGQNTSVLADASTSSGPDFAGRNTQQNPMGGGIRESQLMNCDLRASLAGYRSDVVNLAMHRYLDNPDVGTIVLHRLGNVEGLTISATSAFAPKAAKKAYDHGREAERKGKLDQAQKDFDKAVEVYPKYAAAWYELGRIYAQHSKVEEARKAYNQAVAADPKYVNPHEGLYRLAAAEGKWQEVADTTDEVLRLNPFDFPQAYFFNAIANVNLKRPDVAEKSAREAIKLDPEHRNPRTAYVLGLALAGKGDFTAAVAQLRSYLEAAPNATDAEVVKKQLAEIEKLAPAQSPK